MKINTDTAVQIANLLCAQMHQVAREDKTKRGDFELSWIAGCVLAARFYADGMGIDGDSVTDLIQKLSKFASVVKTTGETQ